LDVLTHWIADIEATITSFPMLGIHPRLFEVMTGGNKNRTTYKAKKRSAGHTAQFNTFVCKKVAPDKENIPPAPLPPSPKKPKKLLTDWKDVYTKLRRKYC
jgi:hypothetical protein